MDMGSGYWAPILALSSTGSGEGNLAVRQNGAILRISLSHFQTFLAGVLVWLSIRFEERVVNYL
jgi:hypothetical protein